MIKNEDFKNQILLTFQDRVREEIRKGNVHGKMTVSILAEKSGVKESTLQSYLKNDLTKMPSLSNAKAIADALHVPLDYLISDTEIHLSQEITAGTLLKNLYRVYCDTNLQLRFVKGCTTQLTSHNPNIYLFLSQIQEYKNINELIAKYSKLKVYKGELVEPILYEELLKNDFIHLGIKDGEQVKEPLTEKDLKDYPEEYYEESSIREKIWEELKVKENSKRKTEEQS